MHRTRSPLPPPAISSQSTPPAGAPAKTSQKLAPLAGRGGLDVQVGAWSTGAYARSSAHMVVKHNFERVFPYNLPRVRLETRRSWFRVPAGLLLVFLSLSWLVSLVFWDYHIFFMVFLYPFVATLMFWILNF